MRSSKQSTRPATIHNPVLPGFNADPSIVRVGRWYYIATSTFEWFPGVALYRSPDLVRWELWRNLLTRTSQLELRGVGASCGVWAPHLSYHERRDRWFLAYTIVTGLSSSFFDLKNFVVTAADPAGPWSEPSLLNASGFDPALFHDDDGSGWLVNLAWEFRDGYRHPGTIVLQQYDYDAQSLVGEAVTIYSGDPKFGCVEGPQLYKRDGYYYLVTAEGGTGYGHAVLVSRAQQIGGPYHSAPGNPLLTSRAQPHPTEDDPSPDFLKPRFFNPALDLQKAGHGSLVETPAGETYLAHLCARPLRPQLRCTLNRETALQQVVWRDRWPHLAHGSPNPQLTVPAPAALGAQSATPSTGPDRSWDVSGAGREDFDAAQLSPHFYSLRAPIEPGWCSLEQQRGYLSLRGRNSIYSVTDTSLIARRVQHVAFRAATRMVWVPGDYRWMAGLVVMNSPATWYYLRCYFSDSLRSAAVAIMTSCRGDKTELAGSRVALPLLRADQTTYEIDLALELSHDTLQFRWALDRQEEQPIGPQLDATVLSDEYNNDGQGAFSGTFVGVCAQDLDRHRRWAQFDRFDYLPNREIDS